MKKLSLLAFMLLLSAGPSFAQLGPGGSIGLFADPGGTECNLAVVPGSPQTVYVVHVLGVGMWAHARNFLAPLPDCYAGTWLGETLGPYVSGIFGDSQNGVDMIYGYWHSPAVLLAIEVVSQTPIPDCCYWKVLPWGAGTITVHYPMGDPAVWEATGGEIILNPTPDCTCSVSAEESTWGKVKALYGE